VSKYNLEPLDFDKLKTVSIHERGGKVKTADFARPYAKGSGVAGWLDSLPHILAGDSMRGVVEAIRAARQKRKPVIWGMGGHVVKCGLAPVFRNLMELGYVNAVTMNGAASIHDFEIAIAGHTSEDVEEVLPDGSFGSAEETGRQMNRAIIEGNAANLGMGEALGLSLQTLAKPEFSEFSILAEAYRRSIPVTVHVAIGTDTPHTHPAADAAAIGAATHRDFRLFASIAREMHHGGVYLNVGSAVVLPEVFLKAVSVVRNLGFPLSNFTTVNFDFLQHYRPKVNVVERPHARSGGHGYAITGHHELTIPLLAAILIETDQ
jgi:hypothetical protein